MSRSSNNRIIRRQIAKAPRAEVIETPQQRHDRVVAELTAIVGRLSVHVSGEELVQIGESFLVRLMYITTKMGGDDAILDTMMNRVKMRLGAIRIRELTQVKPEGTS